MSETTNTTVTRAPEPLSPLREFLALLPAQQRRADRPDLYSADAADRRFCPAARPASAG